MKRWLFVFLLVGAAASAQENGFDILIRGGRVIDGSGNPWYPTDIGIRGGRIEAVGELDNVRADIVLDATGLYVAPGFIESFFHLLQGSLNPAVGFVQAG